MSSRVLLVEIMQRRHSATNVSTSTKTTNLSSLPNVTATKIISFAQSSQVHPVIAMEVITSGGGSSDHHHLPSTASSSSSSSLDMMKHYFRPITSLVFLASGRDTPIIFIYPPDLCTAFVFTVKEIIILSRRTIFSVIKNTLLQFPIDKVSAWMEVDDSHPTMLAQWLAPGSNESRT